jgi:hypothetical protein
VVLSSSTQGTSMLDTLHHVSQAVTWSSQGRKGYATMKQQV